MWRNQNTQNNLTPPAQVAKFCKTMSTLNFSSEFNAYLTGYEKSVSVTSKKESNISDSLEMYNNTCDLIKFVDKRWIDLPTREQMEVSAQFDYITEVLEHFITENKDARRFSYILSLQILKKALIKLQKARDKYDNLVYPKKNTISNPEYKSELTYLYENTPNK